jgi:VWFA-related protein
MPRILSAALSALCAVCCLSRPAVGQEHSFILLFDYPLGGLHQTEEVSRAVEGWLQSHLAPGDPVAVASYYGCELSVQQDFTQDRPALAGAIDDAVRGRSHTGRPPEGAVSLVAHLPAPEELSRRSANFYGLLQVLAEASDTIPGRKNLVVFSKGFGRSYLFEGENGAVEHADLNGNGLAGSPIQEKYLKDSRLYEPTLAALQAADVTLYPIDLAVDYRETYPLAGVMCQLAAGTGGRYFYPATDVAGLLDRITEDERTERTPDVSGVMSDKSGLASDSSGMMSDSSDVTSDTSDVTPDTSDATPDTSDVASDKSDVKPDTSDRTPDASNAKPDASGRTPDPSGVTPASHFVNTARPNRPFSPR